MSSAIPLRVQLGMVPEIVDEVFGLQLSLVKTLQPARSWPLSALRLLSLQKLGRSTFSMFAGAQLF